MKFNKKLAVAVSGAVLLMAGQIALADSTTDIVDALVSKGVLTEEEGKLITKGHAGEKKAQDKSIKGKLSISSALENANIYGDIRARYERRGLDIVSTGATNGQFMETNRSRYKFTLGVETKAGDWYTDLAFAASSNGRSDNVTFGDDSLGGTGVDTGMSPKTKGAVYIKRAMVGWNATPWLSVEAGRMKNPLYMVNAMVWDHDIVMEGAQEKLKYKMGDTDLFANLGQWVYTGGGIQATNDVITARQNMVYAFQAGAQQNFEKIIAKGAIGYYYYGGNIRSGTPYSPTVGDSSVTASTGVNDLAILDIPAELNFMVTDTIGVKPYGEYVYNTSGSDRKNAAGASYTSLANDDTAWLLGITVGSGKDLKSFAGKKMAQGDWSLNLWYQDVGVWALDQNAVDTDIFDGRVNMKGTTLKAQYNIADNVMFNFTGGWGDRKNSQYASSYTKADLSTNGTNYELYQFDVTYKF